MKLCYFEILGRFPRNIVGYVGSNFNDIFSD